MPVSLSGLGDDRIELAPTRCRAWVRRSGHYLRLAECRQGAFQQVHLGQGEEEGERRFGPLVLVDAVLLEAVAAAAGAWVVELQAQVVAAEEPLEGERASFSQAGSSVAR